VLAGAPSELRARTTSRPPSTIVALYGYGPDSIANLSFSEGLRGALRGAGAGAPAYFSEFLDATRLSSADYASAAHDYLQQKYAGRRVDALIVEGESTFSFLLHHRDTLFTNVPIVHAAVIPALLDAEHAGTAVTGVVARGACRLTIELARRLQPGIDQVYVVLSMPQRHGHWIEAAIREELEALNPPMTVNYLIDLPTADVVKAIEKVPAKSIVLYLRHSDDAAGGALQPIDALTLIAGVSPVPVYGVSASYVGAGIVGGYVAEQRMMGAQVGEMALRVANGASVRDVPVAAAALTPMFDARALRRWQISESRLPSDAVVRFQESTIWWAGHGISTTTGLLMGLAVSGLAGTLWLEHRRRQLAQVEARRHLATMAEIGRAHV